MSVDSENVGSGQPTHHPTGTADKQFLEYLLPCRNDLYVYILSLVGNRADAEDVLQDTSLTLWRKFGEFREDSDFRVWACGIAYNIVRNFWRTRGRSRLRFDSDLLDAIARAHAEVMGEWEERRSVMRRCIGRLSDAEQDLLDQCYASGNQIKCVAERLGRTPNAISKQLGSIRRKLYECIERTMASMRPSPGS